MGEWLTGMDTNCCHVTSENYWPLALSYHFARHSPDDNDFNSIFALAPRARFLGDLLALSDINPYSAGINFSHQNLTSDSED